MGTPDWVFWKNMPAVEQWQACALALDLDPDQMKHECWVPGQSTILRESFPTDEIYKQFDKLARVLKARRFVDQHFTQNGKATVRLDEFAAWCVDMGLDIPQELKAMAKVKTQNAPAAETVEVTAPTPAPADLQPDQAETFAALFDPVSVEALEKMFSTHTEPSEGKWKGWAEKAAANGLKNARTKRAKFNPYKAGVWFVRKGAEGWDDARLHRVLAKNLPARSRGNEYMLTGGTD